MKRIINGVTYNTATAVKIAYSSKKYDDGKYVTMYQTRTGAFFFHLQNYARAEGHLQDWYNEDGVKNPKDFFEKADEVYINPFSSVEAEMQRETAIFVRLPEPLKRAL